MRRRGFEYVRTGVTRIGLGLTLCLVCWAQSNDEKKVVDSFKNYVQHHLDSYKTNRREKVTLLGGGWVKEYYEADVNSAEFDVQRTTSLISPYTGRLEFRMIRRFTAFHKSREEAMADTDFPRTDITEHRHNYAYQDGRWIPKIRQHRAFGERARAFGNNTWFDCAEVIETGANAGETDTNGCLEEYDDAKR
jgi:hypothetical protein